LLFAIRPSSPTHTHTPFGSGDKGASGTRGCRGGYIAGCGGRRAGRTEKKGSRPLPWLGDHVREVCRYAYLSTITPAKPSGNNSIAPSYPEHLSTTGFGCDGALLDPSLRDLCGCLDRHYSNKRAVGCLPRAGASGQVPGGVFRQWTG